MVTQQIIALDVGGSHVTAGSFLFDGNHFHLEEVERIPLDARLPQEDIFSGWEKLIKSVKIDHAHLRLAIAFPAPFDYEKGICLIKEQDKFRNLYEVNIREQLVRTIGISAQNILFLNDAHAFIIGECSFGKLDGFSRVLGLTLGSGLGSALKINETYLDAGLWSQPFKEGIAEDYLSTRWFVRWMAIENNMIIKGVKELVEKREYQEYAKEAFSLFAHHLAEFLELIVFKHHPQVVLISGNISKAADYFLNDFRSILFKRKIPIAVLVTDLGEMAQLLGAASLFTKNIETEDMKKPQRWG